MKANINSHMQVPDAKRQVLMMPRIRPAWTIPLSLGSPYPLSMSRSALLPIIHAGMPVRQPQETRDKIPSTKITAPFTDRYWYMNSITMVRHRRIQDKALHFV
jgi:hypothetical protein